jgi:hypothetical protein
VRRDHPSEWQRQRQRIPFGQEPMRQLHRTR